MSKLEFKPQDRQSIDFAEEERIRFENNGKKDRAVVDASNLSEKDVSSWRNKIGINHDLALDNYLQLDNKSSLSDLFETIMSAGKGIVCTGRMGSADGTNLMNLLGHGNTNYGRVYFEPLGANTTGQGAIIKCTMIAITGAWIKTKYLYKGNFNGYYGQTNWA